MKYSSAIRITRIGSFMKILMDYIWISIKANALCHAVILLLYFIHVKIVKSIYCMLDQCYNATGLVNERLCDCQPMNGHLICMWYGNWGWYTLERNSIVTFGINEG